MLAKYLLKTSRYHWIGISVLFAVALIVTLTNLGISKEFVGDDATVGYHFPAVQFQRDSNMWDSYTFPGRSNVSNVMGLFHSSFVYSLDILGLSTIIVDRIIYFLVLFLSSLGMYFLSLSITSKIFKNRNRVIVLASLIAGLLYMLNNYTMILFSFPPSNYIYSYVFLPWIFFLYFENFHISELLWKNLCFSLIFILVLSGNPSNTITIMAVLALYEIFFRKEDRIIFKWDRSLITALLIVLLSSYIYLPLLLNSGNPYNIKDGDIDVSVSYNSLSTSITNLLRFRGHSNQESYIFNEFLLSGFVAFLNYILLGLAALFLLTKKLTRKEIFFLVLFLVFLFLAKSVHEPWSYINQWMYEKIPFFGMYRASYYKFTYYCVFALAVLLPIGLLRADLFLKQRFPLSRYILWSLPIFAIAYGSHPFIKGDVAVYFHKTTIPNEYRQLATYLGKTDPGSAVLSLPQQISGLTLDWGEGNYYASGAHPDYFIIDRSVWSSGWFMEENLVSTDFGFYKKLLPLTNIRYVLLHKDVPEEYSFRVGIKGRPLGQSNYQMLEAQIKNDEDLALVLESNYFKLFEIGEAKSNNKIIIPKTVFIKNSVEDILDDDQPYTSGSMIVVNDTSLSRSNTQAVEEFKEFVQSDTKSDWPTLSFEEISRNQYKVRVENAFEKFPILLNEGYHDGWVISQSASNVTPMSIFQKSSKIADYGHVLANGYMNGWLIDPSQICSKDKVCQSRTDGRYDFDFIIDFVPQRYHLIGRFIFFFTLLACAVRIGYTYRVSK